MNICLLALDLRTARDIDKLKVHFVKICCESLSECEIGLHHDSSFFRSVFQRQGNTYLCQDASEEEPYWVSVKSNALVGLSGRSLCVHVSETFLGFEWCRLHLTVRLHAGTQETVLILRF